MAEVALQYNDSYNEIILSFANNVHTPEGGMHEEGFKRALTNGPQRLRQEDQDAEGRREGLRRGLPGGPDLRHLRQARPRPSSRARPRPSWATPRSAPWSTAWSPTSWRTFWRRTPPWAGPFWTRPSTASRAREAARKARESVRRKTGLESGQMPDKLRDCNETGPGPDRNLHRRGRFRRRLRHPGPGRPVPGHPAPVGQDAERGKGPGRPGLRQR